MYIEPEVKEALDVLREYEWDVEVIEAEYGDYPGTRQVVAKSPVETQAIIDGKIVWVRG